MKYLVTVSIVIAAICVVIWEFYPEKMTRVGWIIFGACAIYGLLSAFLPERILKRRIGQRKALAFDEIYRMDFQQLPYSRNLIENAWNELAGDFALAAGKLRPADRFEVELSVKGFPFDDLSAAANDRLVKRLREVRASSSDAKKTSSIKTVRDYVEFICAIECKRAP